MHELKIKRGSTREEKGALILHLTDRVNTMSGVQKKFSFLFGDLPPHLVLEHLTRLNSRALLAAFNRSIFALLDANPHHIYKSRQTYEQYSERPTVKPPHILDYWALTDGENHPHHLVPRSRGGTNSKKNIWHAGDSVHQSFHVVFHNLTPYEQIALVLNRYKAVFSPGFIREVESLRSHYPEPHCFKGGVIVPDRFV